MATNAPRDPARDSSPATRNRQVLEGIVHYAIANGEKLRELWDVVNKDARATEGVRKLVDAVRAGLAERDPVTRLSRQLDAIGQAIEDEAAASSQGAAPRPGEGPAEPDLAGVRRARVERIRGKLELASQMPAGPRRKAVQRLTSEVGNLFAEVVEDGLESPPPAPSAPARKLPWQRKSSPADF